ncbi:YitT family protein [Desulfovibrio sp. OttesenSCG-928-G11]|nr:YitT family protein [Desulfovibrio sp. OttesenSCG-928-G11]
MFSQEKMRAVTMSVPWNLFLLTVGGLLSTFALKCIANPHDFVSGGLYGFSMLIVYATDHFGIAAWYALFNIPVLLLGWFFLSRRFMLYTIYCIAVTTVATQLMTFDAGISDKTLAAIAAGTLCGAGSGIAMRSLGSDGGLNIISLILNQKYNINVGTPNIVFNFLLFIAALPVIKVDNVLYSMIITYLTSSLTNYFLGMFDQRKLVFIISERHQDIAQSLMRHLGRGCTLLHGQGAFTRQEREVLFTVVHNIQLKRLEELVYKRDPHAFLIIENTHLVLGKGFSQRKQY